jgi:phosphatidyl-myo-inositol dimannoside synthase
LKPSDSKTILYVGRLIKQKGIDLLVESFVEIIKEIPDARLEIIGYGPEKEHILNILRTNKVEHNVTITEMVPHDSLPEIYGHDRILTLPALIPEGLGMTPAEAGLSGVPTVTFGLGGTSELIINGKTGLIVEPTRDGLKSGLLTLLRNGDLADQMGQNAREHLANIIGWPSVAAKFDLLFKDVINSHRAKRVQSGMVNTIMTILIAAVSLSYLAKLFFDRFQRLMGLFK